ncbi:MAG: endolytic transglycosylase MltG [Candidatus Gottesmanbacteria bacterium]|nr:endolytic transglycosylase MltG [Candidatus Gottesmanbacteria bacterium]
MILKYVRLVSAVGVGILIGVSVWWVFFGPAYRESRTGVFAVPPQSNAAGTFDVPAQRERLDIAKKLSQEGYIRNATAFRVLMWVFARDKGIVPGGYRLDPAMTAWAVMKKMTGEPQLVWVTTWGCLRKEQVGEMIAPKLGWTGEQLVSWNAVYNENKPEWAEGVFFPDTYLLPKDEPVEAVAKRFIDNFNAKLSPILGEYVKQNIKWTTGLKIASLIQREAAGPEDMNLIAGIIWNRLNTGMKLEIDATMQYTKGKKSDGSWWGGVDLAEKRKDSPYNTYLHKGLPPKPICSPGMDAIRAVLEPEETECLFYLHDRNKQVHCAVNYEGHLNNIKSYLR